jgi:hypothetical protein
LADFAESIAGPLPDETGEPLWGLVEIIADQIADYEFRHRPKPEASGTWSSKSCRASARGTCARFAPWPPASVYRLPPLFDLVRGKIPALRVRCAYRQS